MAGTGRICTILARGGSKGLPGKNIRMLQGRPLIRHTIDQALSLDLFDAVAVSSDAEDILDVARDAGVAHVIRRPDEMAHDTASKLPAVEHCIAEVERATGLAFETIVDLDPTSPLRSADDVRGAVALFDETGAPNVITGAASRKSPYFNLVECDDDNRAVLSKKLPHDVYRRQDSPRCFDMNAAVYVWRRGLFRDDPKVFYDGTRLYEMPDERSHDIDSPLDFEFVEFVMSRESAA